MSSSYAKNIGGNIFSRMGDSPKQVKSKRLGEKKQKEIPKVGNNNGQLRIAMGQLCIEDCKRIQGQFSS